MLKIVEWVIIIPVIRNGEKVSSDNRIRGMLKPTKAQAKLTLQQC